MFVIAVLLLLVAGLAGWAYLTNPFNRFTVIKLPFVVTAGSKPLQAANDNQQLRVRQAFAWKVFAIVKNGIHILSSRWVRSPGSQAKTVKGIIADIRRLRFDPQKLLLISGDHFSALFVRNLGVFYYPTLDTRIPDNESDWHDRQAVYMQTLAYALGVFEKYPIPTTTIVPTGALRATCVNIYAYPPDTVYAMLYALAALLGREAAAPTDYAKPLHTLDSVPAALQLFGEYQQTLVKLYEHYRQTVFDEDAGLIKKGVHLSGAKDITKRSCSFYDNVVFWKTTGLAMDLGLIPSDEVFLKNLKKRILKAFWVEDSGYFLEDLSEEGIANKYYSSDWLIVLVTGFLQPKQAADRKYLERCCTHIQTQKIDEPFPLKYHPDTRRHRQFFAVRIAVASYGGDAIWSFWGMEYIKLLMLLYKQTSQKQYLLRADKHIASYKRNMLRDGGFPEVYDSSGRLLETLLYRSIRQTGWVIGFEQVLAMRQALREKA